MSHKKRIAETIKFLTKQCRGRSNYKIPKDIDDYLVVRRPNKQKKYWQDSRA